MNGAIGIAHATGLNNHGQLGDGTTTNRHWLAGVDPFSTWRTTQVAAGSQHALFLCIDGSVRACGLNDRGQLGDGTTSDQAFPMEVQWPSIFVGDRVQETRPLDGIIALAAGSRHSLALRADGKVLAWGANDKGQLGDGTTTDRTLPVEVAQDKKGDAFVDIVAIAAGASYSVALRGDGGVWTWGQNESGELGDGTTTERHAPVPTGVGRVKAIAARGNHSLALVADGTLRAWGTNDKGQLGDGTFDDRLKAVSVKGDGGVGALDRIIAIAAGVGYSLALRADGIIWSWGKNNSGQLGNGTLNTHKWPIRVKDASGSGWLSGVTAIAAGASHTLAIQSMARVFAWGRNNFGQLGDNTTVNRSLPVLVSTGLGTGVIAIAAGQTFSLVVQANCDALSWGANDSGQLGTVAGVPSEFVTAPFALASAEDYNFSGVAAGNAHSLALRPGTPFVQPFVYDAGARAWGSNAEGQLGDDSGQDHSSPQWVAETNQPPGIKAIATGINHSLALLADGKVWAWGSNSAGQLGDGTKDDQPKPVPVHGPGGDGLLTHIVVIAAGSNHSLALRADGTVWAWGNNSSGQLGDDSVMDRMTPVQAKAMSFITAVAAGAGHSLALRADGTVWAWGAGTRGQLGSSLPLDHHLPARVKGLASGGMKKAIAAGANHSLSVRADGSVWAWGANEHGQVGDGSVSDRLLPVQAFRDRNGSIEPLSSVTAAAGGEMHSLALDASGIVSTDGGFVWCWGANDQGQLGDGTMDERHRGVAAWQKEGGALRRVAAIAGGRAHSLAVGTGKWDLEAWLAAKRTVREQIFWETPDSGAAGPYYHEWSAEMKHALSDAVLTLLAGGSLGIIDPPPLAYEPPKDKFAETRLSKPIAWSIFIGHVAQSIVVDARRCVPWSLTQLSGDELRYLLDSRSLFQWDPSVEAYRIMPEHGYVTPGDPAWVFTFLVARDIIGASRLDTIHRFLDWCRANLAHFGGSYDVANYEDYWQYPGEPPVRRIIEGTIHPNYADDPPQHWSAGCHGTVGFFRAVLRTVNIPVARIYCAGHAQPHFLHEGVYLSHGDDVYISSFMMNVPPIPSSEFLIDQSLYDIWFDPALDINTLKGNVGRQKIELAVKHLSYGLLQLHCEDLDAAASPANSKVYERLKDFWTLQELEASDLWTKMDQKLTMLGGCSAIPGE